jgi:hypothetical protein
MGKSLQLSIVLFSSPRLKLEASEKKMEKVEHEDSRRQLTLWPMTPICVKWPNGGSSSDN